MKTSNKQGPRAASSHYLFLFAGSVAYAFITLSGPINSNRYNLSLTQIRSLQLTLVIPIILIWCAAFYGAVRFKRYASTIQESPDGKALSIVSNGLLVLSYGLVTQSLFSSLRPRFIANDGNIQGLTIFSNYLNLAFPLIAFSTMLYGANRLIKLQLSHHKETQTSTFSIAATVISIAALATLFTYSMFHNPYRNSTPDVTKANSYFLPDGMLWLTIVLPSIVLWTVGILTAMSVRWYAQRAKGIIYKKALHRLVQGLTMVVFFSISMSLLTTIGPSLSGLKLSGLLALIYVIIIFYAVSYLLIASGAKKLAKIEEI